MFGQTYIWFFSLTAPGRQNYSAHYTRCKIKRYIPITHSYSLFVSLIFSYEDCFERAFCLHCSSWLNTQSPAWNPGSSVLEMFQYPCGAISKRHDIQSHPYIGIMHGLDKTECKGPEQMDLLPAPKIAWNNLQYSFLLDRQSNVTLRITVNRWNDSLLWYVHKRIGFQQRVMKNNI